MRLRLMLRFTEENKSKLAMRLRLRLVLKWKRGKCNFRLRLRLRLIERYANQSIWIKEYIGNVFIKSLSNPVIPYQVFHPSIVMNPVFVVNDMISSKSMKKKIWRNWLFHISYVCYKTQFCVWHHSFKLTFVKIYE